MWPGLKSLDALLQGKDSVETTQGYGPAGGLTRGQVAEIWGPAGVGKTAFAYVICNVSVTSNEISVMCQSRSNLRQVWLIFPLY